jgi:hypothetical protein
MPSAAPHIETIRFELESGLFTQHSSDLGRALRAGAAVLMHALRARLFKMLAAN